MQGMGVILDNIHLRGMLLKFPMEYTTIRARVTNKDCVLKCCSYTYVTAAGLGALLPVSTLGPYGFAYRYGHGAGHNDDSVWDGYRIPISIVGGHALASPKGGGPCSLGTCSNYLIATHLACQ